MIYNILPMLLWMAEDEKVDRNSQARTAARKRNAKKTRASHLGRAAEHLKADSKRFRLRAWLRHTLRRGYSTTTDVNKTVTQASPGRHCSSVPRLLGQIKLLQPVLRERYTNPDVSNPPAYDDQGALPPLYVGLSREDEIRVMYIADSIMEKAHVALAHRFELATLMAVAAAVHEGCISAAATVCKAALQKTVAELNDIVDEGCHDAARAVIAAAAATPKKNWIGVASGAAGCIMLAAKHHVEYNKIDRRPYAAAAQLVSTVHSVAATICFRIINDNPVLDDIHLPAREETLPGR